MSQEDNYFKPEDYEHLRKMIGDHGADSLSGLQRALLGMSAPMEQDQQVFSPHIETYSAREPLIDEEEVTHYTKPRSVYQRLKDVTGGDMSPVELMMMKRLQGDED